ncbi:unnamed protein product [Closterium sp. NIES-65]|nr:unnamed protein product [Closterium sp. NIES-65]
MATTSGPEPPGSTGSAAAGAVEEEEMSLCVRWAGKELTVGASGDDTVGELKRRICEATGVLPTRQKLLNLKLAGRPAPDSTLLSQLAIKPSLKIMMMGTVESEIVVGPSPQEAPDVDVLDDLQLPEDEAVAIKDRPENLAKLRRRSQHFKVRRSQQFKARRSQHFKVRRSQHFKVRRSQHFKVRRSQHFKVRRSQHFKVRHSQHFKVRRSQHFKLKVLNPPRAGKRLLVLDIDYTLFDHVSPAENAAELMRPCSCAPAHAPLLMRPCESGSCAPVSQAHAPLLMRPCSCAPAHAPLLMRPCSCAPAHAPLLMRPCSCAPAHAPLLMRPCSCAPAHAPLLMRPCSCAPAHAPLLMRPCESGSCAPVSQAHAPLLMRPCECQGAAGTGRLCDNASAVPPSMHVPVACTWSEPMRMLILKEVMTCAAVGRHALRASRGVRVVYRASGVWGEWFTGRVVYGASGVRGEWCTGRVVYGASGVWGEWCMGRVVYGASGVWGEWVQRGGQADLHEFLAASYSAYDIIIWSATSMRWVEVKMRELGVLGHSDYRVLALVDHMAMITVHSPHRGVFDCKPLQILWDKFPEHYSEANTIMFDDLRRNFVMNPRNGLTIRPFRRAHANRHSDRELAHLTEYLLAIADLDDWSQLDHNQWERFMRHLKK